MMAAQTGRGSGNVYRVPGPARRLDRARLAALRAALRLLVRAPAGPPLPVAVQRAWFGLMAHSNRSRRRVPRTAIEADGVWAERLDGSAERDPPRILYLHGGAYCLHSPRVYRPLASSLAQAAGATVYVADYRRAPEHPCPAALNDALGCYRWLLGRRSEPGRIAIVGDSAGGGLSLATAVAIRDAGLPAPAAVALISPWTDLTLSGASLESRAHLDVVLRHRWLAASARMYRGGIEARDPRCSPLFADLAGLPPTLIQAASDDILLSDSERLAERLAAAGGAVEMQLHERLFHLFQAYPALLPQAEAAIGEVGSFVRREWRD